MYEVYRQIMSHVNGMTMQHWGIAAAVVIVVGFICMRGLGSRSGF